MEHSENLADRYSRQLRLKGFGPGAQQKLAAAKVLVIGAGGLGVPVLQYLAGMGVGTIGIVDDDVVSLSNLHRQVLYRWEDIGQPKVLMARLSLQKLNSNISIQPFQQRLVADYALSILSDFDIVVDATDNFATRYLINDACVILQKPFVYGAVQGYEGHVSVFNFNGGPTYRCVYPSPPEASAIPDCNEAGVLGVLPGIIGSIQALQVVKLITGISETLSGYLLVFDFLNDEQFKIKLKQIPGNLQITALQQDYGDISCSTSTRFLKPEVVRQWQNQGRSFSLIDVRDSEEFLENHISFAMNIPLSELNNLSVPFDKNQAVVLYCQKGSRSAHAFSMLRLKYPELELYELAGGLEAWVRSEK